MLVLWAAGLAASAKGLQHGTLRAAVVMRGWLPCCQSTRAPQVSTWTHRVRPVVQQFRQDCAFRTCQNACSCLAHVLLRRPFGQAAGSILGYRSHEMLQLRGIFSGT